MAGHITRIKIRGYHTDFYGHVNNARYLEFYEEDRWAWFDRAIDVRQWMKKGLTFAIVNINVNYRLAVILGMTIEVRSRLERIGGRSATIRQEIVVADTGQVASDALVTFVITDRNGRVLDMNADVPEVQELISLAKQMSNLDQGQRQAKIQPEEKP
ncbi:MAG: acyl-CoA thioesterase [Desulfobulbaceae bacterium]|nr:acyl-CoA thioesterase [Desulfobulbaceae bacterium]